MAEVQEGFQELKTELLKLGPENPKKTWWKNADPKNIHKNHRQKMATQIIFPSHFW